MHATQHETPSDRLRTAGIALLALIVSVFLALSGLTAGATQSQAATEGHMMDYGGWLVGSHRLESGEIVYCIEPGALTPDGPQQVAQEVTELRSYSFTSFNATGWAGVATSETVSGEPIRHINYVLSEYGATSDPREAVSVQFALWLLRDQPGEAAYINHHIAWVESHGGSAEIARARDLVAEARAVTGELRTASAPEAPRITRDETGLEGTVSYSAGTTQLSIAGAAFADGTHTAVVSGETAGELTWSAVAHANGWQASHSVHVDGEWERKEIEWPARLELHQSELPGQQHLAWTVGPVSETVTGTFVTRVSTESLQFEPTLSTRVVQQLLGENEVFADTVTISSGKEGSSTWPQRLRADGTMEWLPLAIEGTLFGPFAEEQEVREEAPESAPVFEHVSVVADAGPGSYELRATQTPTESGYYYWVWEISEAAQAPESASAQFLPEGYLFRDRFGLPEEMHLVTIPVTEEESEFEPDSKDPVSPTVEITHPSELAETGGSMQGVRIASAAGLGAIALGSVVLLAVGIVRQRKDMQSSRR